MKQAKRALWLMNHTTLRQFEVPMLEELGYEVYLPKRFPYDEGNISASIDWTYDDKLTIPGEALAILNENNFYEELPDKVAQVINEYFDLALFGFFPRQLQELVLKFYGTLIMRPFGLANGMTYTKITADFLGYFFLPKIEQIRDRFWFGQAYDHLGEIEQGVYRQNALTLPIGLKNAFVHDHWVGDDRRVFFICPRIKTSPYFHRIYQEFKRNFGHFPHLIGGAQPLPVYDESVTGFVSKDRFEEFLTHLSVMYYHSQEKRHLHYHPLEAVKQGMPLVFMAGGLLDELGGVGLPGRCKTVGAAVKKIARILDGDKKLIEEMRSTQGRLLEKVHWDYCAKIWRENFIRIEQNILVHTKKEIQIKTEKKIAVILPIPYRGGTLDTAKRTAKMIKKGAKDCGREVEVVFAYPNSPIYHEADFADLLEAGINTRQFSWEIISKKQFSTVQRLLGYEIPPSEDIFLIPNDGINYFLDCDYWLIAADRVEHPLAPVRPYGILAHDYIQRYIPELFGAYYEYGFIQAVRNAVVVLTTTPHTMEDCIQYAGVARSKVRLIPLVSELYQGFDAGSTGEKGDYFIWTTNASIHKNHLRTLEALVRYLDQKGNLACYVTGVETDLFDLEKEPDLSPDAKGLYIKSIRDFMKKHKLLKDKLHFLGELSKPEYVRILAGARFLLHTALMDNGTFCAIEAASLGVPTLSSDYPPMRFLSEQYTLNCHFFDPYHVLDLSEMLLSAEQNHQSWRRELPRPEELNCFGWEKQAERFWRILAPFVF